MGMGMGMGILMISIQVPMLVLLEVLLMSTWTICVMIKRGQHVLVAGAEI